MISDEELLAKVEADEGLTVDEIKRYNQLVKPKKQVYGKYGTLKRMYLEDKGIDWTIANLPEYLHGVDKQAEETRWKENIVFKAIRAQKIDFCKLARIRILERTNQHNIDGRDRKAIA